MALDIRGPSTVTLANTFAPLSAAGPLSVPPLTSVTPALTTDLPTVTASTTAPNYGAGQLVQAPNVVPGLITPGSVLSQTSGYFGNYINGGATEPVAFVEKMHTSNAVTFEVRMASNGCAVQMWIMDALGAWRPVFLDFTTVQSIYGASPPGAGAAVSVTFTWSGAATRRIRFGVALGQFWSVRRAAGADGVALTANPVRFMVQGDSWGEGSGTVNGWKTFPMFLGQLLNVGVAYNASQGSTGLVAPGVSGQSKTAYGSTARRAGITQVNPTHFLLQGSINDQVGNTPANRGAATTWQDVYDATLDQLRWLASNFPACRVFVSGPQDFGGTPAAGILATDDAMMQAAKAAQADAGSTCKLFYSPVQQDWITGTGNANAPQNALGDGNSDLYIGDGSNTSHPSPAGAVYMAQRHAYNIAPKLRA